MNRHTLKIIIVGTTLLLGLIVLRVIDPFFVETARLKGLDYYQRNEQKLESDDIIIVEIDEKSLEQNGQWPWSRDVISQGIKKAFDNEANVVVLPILFSEKDRMGKDNDLIEALNQYPVITSQSAAIKGKGVPVPRGVATIGTGINDWLFNYPNAIGPIKEIGESSAGVGMLLTAPEIDGVVRRLPLIVLINNEIYPTVPLEVLRVISNQQSYQAKVTLGGIEAIRVPGYDKIKTDSNARIWVNFKYTFKTISFSDADWSQLKGKIVFITPTAEGLSNMVTTPINITYGHELIAQALQMLINKDRLERPSEFDIYEIGFLLLIGLLLILSITYLNYTVSIILFLFAIILPFITGNYLFTKYNMLADYTFPTFAILVSWMGGLFMRFVMEFKLKQQIKKQFETYLSPDQVAQLQKNPEALKLGGEERELSIMFTDVRGFTAISEHYGKNVQELTKMMNRYMTAMTKNILENKGTLDKYIGDAQMAFWNAPLDNKYHAVMAVATGLAMLKALKLFNDVITKEGSPAFGMGIGINTGNVVVGNMGSDQRFDYTCLGDHVNLASRLEGQSKSYGVKLIIGPKTNEYVKSIYPTLELDCIAVKGKKEGVNIYTVFEANVKVFSKSHEHFLQNYRSKDWKEAIFTATHLINNQPELKEYYTMMLERIEYFKSNDPGKDWDGVYRATSK